jgi:hypothetical protein
MTTGTDRWRPVLPIDVVPRPRGVFAVKVPDAGTLDGRRFGTGGLCWVAEHPVYLGIRPLHDTMPGCQGNEKARTFWICAACYPPKDEP